MSFISLGIDMSSQAKNTAACVIEWTADNSIQKIHTPKLCCRDQTLDTLIEGADVIGVDAPFGWPEPFKKVVEGEIPTAWTTKFRDNVMLRMTDQAVIRILKENFPNLAQRPRPLSVSTDRIALPAMRTMALLNRHGVTDMSGTKSTSEKLFCEVYPAASLAMWELTHRGYKNGPRSADVRRGIVELLAEKLAIPQHTPIPEVCRATDHALDAFIASLTAKLVSLGCVHKPIKEHDERAYSEGWIHVPEKRSLERLCKKNQSIESAGELGKDEL